MTKILYFALKIKGGGREGGTCEVLRPCHPLKIWNVHFQRGSQKYKFFSREALISGEGRPENLGEMGNTEGHLLLCKLGGGESQKSISVPTPWYQDPCDSSISLHARPIVRKIQKEPKFDPFLGPFPPKI